MVQQAKLVTAKPAPGGTTTIKIPRKIGLGHGDIVSAWVLAVHRLAYSAVATEKVVLEPGTPEWNAEFERRVRTREEGLEAKYIKELEAQVRRGMSGRRRQAFQA